VAEVRDLHDVAVAQHVPPFQGREDGAIPFAVAAGVADRQLTFCFREEFIDGHAALLPGRRCGPTQSRSSFRIRPGIRSTECCRT
jgi:hypothetical protein